MTYEDLLLEAEKEGLAVKEVPLMGNKGRIKGKRIAIKKDLSNTGKKCTLIEELGHHKKTVGNILDQSKVVNRKQERLARAWGYEELVTPAKLINAKKEGVRNRYELAEYLGVEELFLENVLNYYKEKYGSKCISGDYVIQFDPLEVFKKIF